METEGFILLSILFLAVILSGLLVNMLSDKGIFGIKLLLAFSGGYILAITFLHLIPEIYKLDKVNVGIFVLAGFILQWLLEYFSKGIEHGHFHYNMQNIFPVGVFISMCLHSFIEGIPLEREINPSSDILLHQHQTSHGFYYGILFHKIPVSIALMTLLIRSEISFQKRWTALIIFGLMAPAGAVFAHYNGLELILGSGSNHILDMTLALVIGMLLHIGTTIIFETSDSHRFNVFKLISVILGMALAVIFI